MSPGGSLVRIGTVNSVYPMRSKNSLVFPSPYRFARLGVVLLPVLMLSQPSSVPGQTQLPAGWSARDMHPAEYAYSQINGVGETVYAGQAMEAVWVDNGEDEKFLALQNRAGYWRQTDGAFVNRNPPEFSSMVLAIRGETLAGYKSGHAALWTSLSAPVIDLHPAGYASSIILATNGREHAGSGYLPIRPQVVTEEIALLWTGTSAQCVVLPIPPEAQGARAAAIGTRQQGGVSYFPNRENSGRLSRAFLWNGANGSYVDLHPRGAIDSEIFAMTDAYQAGRVDGHAALWSGSSESVKILSPVSSATLAASGPYQVGMMAVNGRSHATLWASSADSAVDLHALVPDGYDTSMANSVWADGDKIVIGGCVMSGDYGRYDRVHAFLWTYTPPASATGSVTQAKGTEGTIGTVHIEMYEMR